VNSCAQAESSRDYTRTGKNRDGENFTLKRVVSMKENGKQILWMAMENSIIQVENWPMKGGGLTINLMVTGQYITACQ